MSRRARRAAVRVKATGAVTWVGAAPLAAALAASAMLVAAHFGERLPGCGPQSDCEAVAATAWGRVPGLGWPIAFVGLAYFAAMLAAWTIARGVQSPGLRAVARAGGAVSVLYVTVMLVMSKLCPYCLVVHAANLAFVALLELMAPRPVPRPWRRPGLAFATTFAVVTIALGVAQRARDASREAQAAREREELVERASGRVSSADVTGEDRWGPAGFTGRYRIGPEAAPIRIVAFVDYQCEDCELVEREIDEVLARHPDVSLSVKHFPMNADCNSHLQQTLHDNACWAARAAEAAGMLGGDEAFWRMHRWLFSVRGRFLSPADLRPGVEAAGLQPQSFARVMEGSETLARVEADIEDGMALGIFFTPMVFVNGVEVKWSLVPGETVTKAVDALAAKGLPARTAAADRPALAGERYVEDWRVQAVSTIPPATLAWPMGAASPRADVVVFGDYATEAVGKVDRAIREAMATRPFVRYTFRHYPVNADCNPALPERLSQVEAQDCVAARSALSAGLVDGEEGFWKAHDSLLAGAGRAAALETDAHRRAMDDARVSSAIAADARAARDLGIRSLPLVLVDGRRVPRPLREGDNVMARILDEASE